MNWRKLNRILHRDIGYFFFGMSIIYGISGIALNHIDDWDPSYQIRNEETRIEPSLLQPGLTSRGDLTGEPGLTKEGGLTREGGLTGKPGLTSRGGLTGEPGLTKAGGLTGEPGLTREEAISILQAVNVSNRYKSHYFPAPKTLKIFVEGGSVIFNMITGEGIIEIVSRRPVFYQFNFLHYNNPKFLWTWFADIYGAGLVIMALTGFWMIQGKRGFYGRGKWYVIAGILIPVLFLLLYL
jgi:hypothetical protein